VFAPPSHAVLLELWRYCSKLQIKERQRRAWDGINFFMTATAFRFAKKAAVRGTSSPLSSHQHRTD
jgi:hypothetical protein